MSNSPRPDGGPAAANPADRLFAGATLQTRTAEIATRRAARPQSGRGIVIVAGGARIFVNAYVLVSVLRSTLACKLPIEIWYFGRGELSAAMAAALEGFDVDLIDAQAMVEQTDCAVQDGWQLKPFAMLWSRFAEVILLDADQVPVTDPAPLFAWPAYQQSGAVFWPDIVDVSADNPVWSALGLSPETTTSFESGQVLLDKRRHLEPLAATVALNERAEVLYRMVYGDKDTFLLAWRLLAASFSLVPHRPFVDEMALIQRDFDGAPLFQHRTSCKWTYDGEQFRLPGFVHEDACLAALATLRGKWNGRVFNPPARSAEARAIETRLIALGRFRLDIVDEGETAIALRPHCEFGEGRWYDRQNWFVGDPTGGSERHSLIFRDGERVTYAFHEAAPGFWAGRRFRLPAVEVTLAAEHPEAGVSDDIPAGLVDDLLRAAAFTSNEEGDADLARSLALIARAETGVEQRLRALAAVESDPGRAGRLHRLAAIVASGNQSVAPVRWRDLGVLNTGYLRRRGPPD